VVSSKISRRSLRVSKEEDYRSTAKRKGTNWPIHSFFLYVIHFIFIRKVW
jgi:hypothetical protein